MTSTGVLLAGTAGDGRAVRYIGRVGALAVALGIGAAVVTMSGIAGAAPDAAGSTGSADGSGTAGAQDDSSSSDVLAPSASAVPAADAVDGSLTTAAITDAADPRDGTVQASGGANTTVTTSDESATHASVSAADTGAAANDETSATAEVATAQPPAAAAESGATPATDSAVGPRPTSTVTANTIESADTAALESTPAVAAQVVAPTPRVTTSVALITPSPGSATLDARPVGPVTGVVTRVVSLAVGLFASALSPTPLAPEPPATWVLLAWVRRQFESLLDEPPQVSFGPITTSQSEAGIITGTIPSVDTDLDPISTRVVAAPVNGAVTVDSVTGQFTYIPGAALARSGGIDTFTVTVDDIETRRNGLTDLIAAIAGGKRDDAVMATVLVSVLPAEATDPNNLDASELIALAADGKVRIHTNDDGTVRIIDGTFTDTAVRSDADAAGAMNSIARLLGAGSGFADETSITTQRLELDGRPWEVIYRLAPTVNGIPVMSSQVVLVTDGDGTVTGVFSSYDNRINDVDTTSSAGLDEETVAIAAARAALITSLTEQADPAAVLAAVAMTSDLVIYDVDPRRVPTLARRVTVYTAELDADAAAVGATYYIHANGPQAGEVFAEITNLHDASTEWVTTTVTTTDLKRKSRTITVEYQASSRTYRFNDVTRLVGTYSASSTSSAPGTMVIKKRWGGWNRSAVSAHANTAVTYDYYLNTLAHWSFDDAGSALRVSVLPNTYDNAYWDPNLKLLVFGRDLEAALDVVGHEFTHGVVQYAVANGGGLIYQGETGALNESYADILGSLIENKTGAARWQIAEDYRCGRWSGCTIRDMSNPAKYGQPTHYANRYTGTADYGGVHSNSGIFNFAAYKMMTDPRTSTVSSATWSRVFYGSLFKLSTNATFRDARAAVLSTANSQGFTAAQQQAIIDAFNAVGITA